MAHLRNGNGWRDAGSRESGREDTSACEKETLTEICFDAGKTDMHRRLGQKQRAELEVTRGRPLWKATRGWLLRRTGKDLVAGECEVSRLW